MNLMNFIQQTTNARQSGGIQTGMVNVSAIFRHFTDDRGS